MSLYQRLLVRKLCVYFLDVFAALISPVGEGGDFKLFCFSQIEFRLCFIVSCFHWRVFSLLSKLSNKPAVVVAGDSEVLLPNQWILQSQFLNYERQLIFHDPLTIEK